MPTVKQPSSDYVVSNRKYMTQPNISVLSNTELLKYSFWEAFNDAANNNTEFNKSLRTRSPHPKAWYDLSIGVSAYHISLTINTIKKEVSAGLYFEGNRELYESYKDTQVAIEEFIGHKLIFREAKKDARFRCFKSIDVSDKKQWKEAFEWLIMMAIKFKEVQLKFAH